MDAFWLTFALLLAPVTAFDPGISNGTCYYGPNNQAAINFIPCGNAAGGVQSCCQARDVCLSSNACYNGLYGVTYVAGCTDDNYDDPKCPYKGDYSSQQWVGLVRCHVSDGNGEEWGPCEEPDDPKLAKGNQQCTCDASSSTAVFTDAAVLTGIASLPVSVGNAIAFSAGFEPSTTSSDLTTTSTSSTRTSTTTNQSLTATSATSATSPSTSKTSTPTALPDASSSPSLSTAAKAGIGVGTAGGVLAISALCLWMVWQRRRKATTVPPVMDQIRPSSVGPWNVEGGNFVNGNMSIVNDHKSRERKSELPTEANEVTTTKTSLGENTIRTSFNTPTTTYQPYQHSPTIVASELDGSPAASTSGLAPGRSAYEKPTYGGPIYEMPG